MKKISVKTIALIIFASLFIFSANSSAAYEEVDKNDSAIVYWSPQAISFPSMSYKLYYRLYNSPDTSWKLLGSTVDTTFVLKKKTTGDGAFVLAVTGCEDNVESDKHTSLDSTAIPSCGWYLKWEGSTLVMKKAEPLKVIERPQAVAYLLNGKKTSAKNLATVMKIQKYRNFNKKEIALR